MSKRYRITMDSIIGPVGALGQIDTDGKVWFDNNRFYIMEDDVKRHPEWFKELVEREWEIIEFRAKYMGRNDVAFSRGADGIFRTGLNGQVFTEPEERLLKEATIKTVKRLPDCEVFSVGDELLVSGIGVDAILDFETITSFSIDAGGNMRYKRGRALADYFLNQAKKKDKEPTAFQWSDELVMELVGEYLTAYQECKTNPSITEFKASKILSQSVKAGTGTANETINETFNEKYVVGVDPYKEDTKVQFTEKRLLNERDWEIGSLKDSMTGLTYPFSSLPDERFTIHSVLRLSDNEVFSVGDKVKWAHHPEFKIQSFRSGIPDTMMFAVDMQDLSYDIREIKRPTPTANDVSKEKKKNALDDYPRWKAEMMQNVYTDNPVLDRNEHKRKERWDLKWEDGRLVVYKNPTGKWMLLEAEGKWIIEAYREHDSNYVPGVGYVDGEGNKIKNK